MLLIKLIEQYFLLATIMPDVFTEKGFQGLVKLMLAEYRMQA